MSATSSTTTATTAVTCKCSKVTVTFANERPKKCVECCCCDCKSALEWCLHQQQEQREISDNHDDSDNQAINPPGAADTTNTTTSIYHHHPIQLLYVDNDILKIETKRTDNNNDSPSTSSDIFELMKLRPGGASLRILSKCCHSIMMTLHPFYFRNRIAIMPDAVGKVVYQDSVTNPITPSLRMQTKFWNVVEMGDLPDLPLTEQVNKETGVIEQIPIPTTASDQPSWSITSGLIPFMMYPLPTRQGFTARTLIDVYVNKQKDTLLLNIPETPLLDCFQTNGGGMLSFTFKNPFYKEKNQEANNNRAEEENRPMP
jgi:hypothetical protein